MRTITAAQAAVLAGTGRAERVRVEVKDSAGTWRDLSSYPGFDAVDSVSIEEDLDDPHRTAEVTLKREVSALSLAPLMTGSAVNLGWDPAGAYAPLLDLWRAVRISAAIVPADRPAAAGDWMVVFEGRIVNLDPAAAETVTLRCGDDQRRLTRAWIEEERVYALAAVAGATVPLRIWAPGLVVALGDYLLPTEARRDVSGSPRFYKVTTAGVCASAEPIWPTSGTVADNTAVHTYQGTTTPGTGYPIEDVMQLIIAAWIATTPLYVPTSPAYAIAQYLQQREPVMDATRKLAIQMGWDFRSKWRAGTGQYEPTLYEPERAKTTPDYTFGPDDVEGYQRLEVDITDVANAGQVIFPNSANLDPEGNPLPGIVKAEDAASIAAYERSFFEIGEDQLSVVDTTAKATTFLTAALSDVSTPKVEAVVQLSHGFPWVELGDLYRLTANGRHFDSDQDLAVVQHSTRWEAGRAKTTLSCRGKPSAGHQVWHDMMGRNLPEQVHTTTVFETAIGIQLAAAEVVGGTQLTMVGAPQKGAHGVEYELHVSEAAGFVPSSSTLRGTTKGTAVTLADLIPGRDYYSKVVPRIRNATKLRRAQPSEELAFVAGRGGAGHLVQEVEWGRNPLNGGFETWNDTGDLPDHWDIGTSGETWGVDFTRGSGSGGASGAQYLVHSCNFFTPGTMRTLDAFTVVAGEQYAVEWLIKIATAGGTGYASTRLKVEWLDYAGAAVSTNTADEVAGDQAGMSVGTWYRRGGVLTAPATAKFARLAISQADAGDSVFHYDEVRAERYAQQQEAWTALPFTSGWVDYGSGLETGGCMKDRLGFVHLKGTVRRTSGTSTIIGTLPVGYRPLSNVKIFVVMCNNLAGRVDIATTGTVTLVIGDPTSFVSLDGVLFLP